MDYHSVVIGLPNAGSDFGKTFNLQRFIRNVYFSGILIRIYNYFCKKFKSIKKILLPYNCQVKMFMEVVRQ